MKHHAIAEGGSHVQDEKVDVADKLLYYLFLNHLVFFPPFIDICKCCSW